LLTDAEKKHLANLTVMNAENFSEISVSRDFAGAYIWGFPTADETPATSIVEIIRIFNEYIVALSEPRELPKTEIQQRV
jgi:hypothetical protein